MTTGARRLVRLAAAKGAGWQAGVIETVMAEYGRPLRHALWGISLTAGMVLSAARADRYGIDRPGPGDAAAAAAKERVRAHFAANYQII